MNNNFDIHWIDWNIALLLTFLWIWDQLDPTLGYLRPFSRIHKGKGSLGYYKTEIFQLSLNKFHHFFAAQF